MMAAIVAAIVAAILSVGGCDAGTGELETKLEVSERRVAELEDKLNLAYFYIGPT